MKQIIFFIALFIVSNSCLYAQDTIEVSVGWNIIGATSTTSLSQFRSEPPGIITSSYYGYSSGYSSYDTLIKGKGYWVKASQSGILIDTSSLEFICGGTVAYSGKTYNTVQIGSQCWFKENLDVGTMVDSLQTQTDNSTIEKYCHDNNSANCTVFGGLYQWNEAMQYSITSGSQGICPTAWHIPTLSQQQELGTTVSNDGNALKAVGQGTGGGAGTNTSGFSALLSGLRSYSSGGFGGLGSSTYFWSSTENDATSAYVRALYYSDSSISENNTDKGYGFSVRCVKD